MSNPDLKFSQQSVTNPENKALENLPSHTLTDEQAKRIKQEFKLFKHQAEFIANIPDMSKIYLWHLTIRGMKDTPFEGGYYHFLLDLSKYPEKPPDIYALNENGSFQVAVKLCIQNFSIHHQDKWVSSFSVIQMCPVIQAVMCRDEEADKQQIGKGIGFLAIDSNKAKELAENSKNAFCEDCKKRLGDYKFPNY